jgi:hypothetical protein
MKKKKVRQVAGTHTRLSDVESGCGLALLSIGIACTAACEQGATDYLLFADLSEEERA